MTAAPTSKLYRPIQPYQTRILRLYPVKENNNSPIICDLLTADFLDTFQYEPLGIRAGGPENDHSTEFTALSYWWGPSPPDRTHSLVCNSIQFPITRYLHEALEAIRPRDGPATYIWVDAICINQDDNVEKAFQVANMFRIFQKAREVVAWLGIAHDNFRFLMEPLDWLKSPQSQSQQYPTIFPDIQKVRQCLLDFYKRPFFQRVWIQQEVFAAKRLVLQCGNNRFLELSSLMVNPGLLDHSDMTNLGIKNDQEDHLVKQLKQAHDDLLFCFERFSRTVTQERLHVRGQKYLHFVENKYPDFVDTLIHFRSLQATNQKDYIYAVVGMTRFPAEPMTLSEWLEKRKDRIFIPIDYGAELSSILCAVSWCLLMKGGLSILARFKVFSYIGSDPSRKLPSWTIDWRLAAQHCCENPDFLPGNYVPYNERINLSTIGINNPWWTMRSEMIRGRNIRTHFPVEASAPPSHSTFRLDNQRINLPLNVIKVRGVRRNDFLICGQDIMEKRSVRSNKIWWHLYINLDHNEIIVQTTTKYLLLLKPIGRNFRILAILIGWEDDSKFDSSENRTDKLYNRWKFETEDHVRWRPMTNKSIPQQNFRWENLDGEKIAQQLEDYFII